MVAGFGYGRLIEYSPPECVSAAQLASLDRIPISVDECLGNNDVHFVGKDWEEILRGRRLSYSGEVVFKAVHLTMVQVLPALPGEGLAASIDAASLVSAKVKKLLENPDLSIFPRERWPEKLSKAKMHIDYQDWKQLGPELFRRGIVGPVQREDMVER